MKYSISGAICFCSFSLYALVSILEEIIPKWIIAYLTANKVSFSPDQYTLDFSFIKIILLCFTVLFGIFALFFVTGEFRKKK